MAIRNLSGETVDGIVGIGTVTPQGKLTVVGAIQTVVADLTANDSVGLSIMGMPANNFNAITLGSANSANNSAVFRFKYNSAGGTDNYLGIGFYANDDILNVRATGKVGINQTIPGSELHIEGNGGDGSPMLKMNASAGSQTFNWISSVTYPNLAADKTIIKLFGQAQSSNNQAYIGFKYAGSGSTSNQLTFGFYANDFLVNLLANGNLGIGTESPENKLHILTSTTDTSSQLMVQNGSTGDAAIKFNISGQSYVIGIDNSDSNKFKISGSSALGTTDRLVVDGSGNVGIGTTSPDARLDVQSSGSWGQYGRGSSGDINVENTNTSVTEGGWISIAGYMGNPANSGFYHMAGITAKKSTTAGDGNYGGDLSFWTTSGGANGEANSGMYQRMTIDSSGNVGISDTSPNTALTAFGSASRGLSIANQQPTIALTDTDTGSRRAYIAYEGGSYQMYISSPESSGIITFQTGGFNERMRIDSSGNVGIGRAPVAYGSFRVLDLAGSSGAIQKLIHTGSTVELQSYASSTVGAVGTATNHPLLFVTNDTERMNILAGGTGTFYNAFNVQGDDKSLIVRNAAGTVIGTMGAESSSTPNVGMTTIRNNGTTTIQFNSNGSSYINGGNVGIGTTAPGSKLNVNGNDNGSPEYSVTLGSTTTAGGTANNASSTPVNKTLLTGYSIPYSAQTNSRLTTCGFLEFASTPGWTGNQRTWAITSGYDIGGLDSGTGGNKMAIILGNAQNVSPQIGTNGAIGESGDGDGANSLVACYWDNSLNMRLANSSRLYTGAGGSAALPMITPGTDKNTGIWYPTSDTWAISTAGDERFRITSTGNVGIGTTSPAATLDVDDDNTGKIRLLRNGSTRVELSNNANEGELSLYRSSTTKTIYISSYYNSYFNGGKVGIGNTSPAGQLDILTSNETMIKLRNSEATSGKDRDFKLDDNNKFEILDNNGTGVSLSQGSGSWSSESDERLKENIIELDNVLENINNLRAVKYNYKNGNDTKIGFIAQDWQKDFSEVIEEGEHLSMKYTETIPVLLKAIQELKDEIEELKKSK